MGRWLVTPLQNEDRAAWAALFRGYLDFYEVSASAEKLDTVWAWLHAADHELNGIVVRRSAGDERVGLAHYRPFPRPLHGTVGCYLDYLFVEPGSRGTGAVDALLTRLREIAAANGWDTVRWITRSGNAQARSTYERLAQRTDLITYDMAPSTVTGARPPAPGPRRPGTGEPADRRLTTTTHIAIDVNSDTHQRKLAVIWRGRRLW